MNRGKVRIYDNKLLFRDTGVNSTLKGDIPSMITDYDFKKTDSHDAKQSINFLDEMHFDIHTKSKSPRDKNLIKSYYKKELYLHLG